jgi:hypothetical protein
MRMLARFPFPVRRLIFDGVPLLPFSEKFEMWYVPGGTVQSTQQLTTLARKRGVGIFMFERGADLESGDRQNSQRVRGFVCNRTYTQL